MEFAHPGRADASIQCFCFFDAADALDFEDALVDEGGGYDGGNGGNGSREGSPSL